MERPSFVAKRRRLGIVAGGAATGILAATALAGCSSSPSGPLTELPRNSPLIGGVWEAPTQNPVTFVTSPSIEICAKPSAPVGAPPVQYVDLTANWDGKNWHSLGQVKKPDSNGYYCVTEIFSEKGILPGTAEQISFDVINTANQEKLSPNGVHTVIYEQPAKTRVAVLFRKATARDATQSNHMLVI